MVQDLVSLRVFKGRLLYIILIDFFFTISFFILKNGRCKWRRSLWVTFCAMVLMELGWSDSKEHIQLTRDIISNRVVCSVSEIGVWRKSYTAAERIYYPRIVSNGNVKYKLCLLHVVKRGCSRKFQRTSKIYHSPPRRENIERIIKTH